VWKRRRSTDKRYAGDNRLIFPKSPYRREGLAPRCRLVASWGRSRSQGLGCSPIKAVRELGLERRETVDERAVYKFGYLLETPRILRYGFMSHPQRRVLTWDVTMRQVRTISRKGWMPTLESLTLPAPSNGGGRHQRVHPRQGTRILRGHMPNTGPAGEEMVRSAWRHAEPGRTEMTWPPSIARR
jgi:hypothetical protein